MLGSQLCQDRIGERTLQHVLSQSLILQRGLVRWTVYYSGIPLLGASAILMDLGITLLTTLSPNFSLNSLWIFLARAVLPSYIVRRTRKSKSVLVRVFTILMNLSRVGNPSIE